MQNWEIKKLSDIVIQINGLWKGKKEPFINIAVIRNTNFSKDCQLKLDDVEYLDVEVKQFESRKLQYGDIIIEKSGGSEKQPVGRPILFDIDEGNYSFSNFTSTLRIKENLKVSPEYLQQYLYYRWLEGDTRDLQSHTTGIHNLDFKKYLEFEIPLPPLEEQKRIVKILDEKFAQLETVKANAKNNLQNAKDLFQSQLTKAFSNTTWEKKTLGDVITVLTDFNANGGYAKLDSNVKMYDEPNYAIMVRTTDLEKNDFENGVKYVDKKAYDMLSKSTIYGNEIIMNKIGSAGKIYLMPCLNRPATLARNAFMMRFVDEMDVRFLFSYLSSPEGTASIMKHVHGAVTKTITKDEVRSIQIPFTSLPEQKRIIEQLDSISQKVRSLEEICTKQLANCDELKQAFLAKAFAGEL